MGVRDNVRRFFGLAPNSNPSLDTLGNTGRVYYFDWDDPRPNIFGPMTRDEALEIPGLARVHHMIVSKLAQLELVADNGTGVENTEQPTALYRTDLGEPPEFRLWCTGDDLYFEGRSLWQVTRGSIGQLTSAKWLPMGRWNVDYEQNVVLIDGVPAKVGTYILFNIPKWAGILNQAQRTLKGARDMERAWTDRMQSPPMIVELHVTDDGIQQPEIDEYIRAWKRARWAGGAAVGATPPGITMTVHTGSLGPADLFLQARDAMRTDIGSHSSVDGGMADSTSSTASLTYATSEGQRADFYEFDLPFWTTPITARLSMDDVVPRGTRMLVRFRPVVAPDRTATQGVMETIKTGDASGDTSESTGDGSGQEQAAAA